MNGYRIKKSTAWSRSCKNDEPLCSVQRRNETSLFAWEMENLEIRDEKIAKSSAKQRSDSFLAEFNSPKSRLRKSVEVGCDAISILKELGDIPLDVNVPSTSLSAPQCLHLATTTPKKRRTPIRKSPARFAQRYAEDSDRFLTPSRPRFAINSPLRNTTIDVTDGDGNSSSLDSDSPVVVNSPLNSSTPTSVLRRSRESKCSLANKIVNNSMDDSEFDVILATTVGILPPPVLQMDDEKTKMKMSRVQEVKQTLFNDSMDDPDTNLLLFSQAAAAKPATLSVPNVTVVNKVDDDDDIMVIEPSTSIHDNLRPSRTVLTPKLRRHGSHTNGENIPSSPTSSRTGQTTGSALRMRRHRSLVDDLQACGIEMTTPKDRATSIRNEPPSRPSPAFNSTLLKPSTMQRYMNKPVQETLPKGPKIPAVAVHPKTNTAAEKWLSSRSQLGGGTIVRTNAARSRTLKPIENSPSAAGRKRPNGDPPESHSMDGNQRYLPVKRPPAACDDVNMAKGTTIITSANDGFISKKLASQITTSQRRRVSNATSPATSRTYIPPTDDSFYDDDIEFAEIVIRS